MPVSMPVHLARRQIQGWEELNHCHLLELLALDQILVVQARALARLVTAMDLDLALAVLMEEEIRTVQVALPMEEIQDKVEPIRLAQVVAQSMDLLTLPRQHKQPTRMTIVSPNSD